MVAGSFNYNAQANIDDGSCEFAPECEPLNITYAPEYIDNNPL